LHSYHWLQRPDLSQEGSSWRAVGRVVPASQALAAVAWSDSSLCIASMTWSLAAQTDGCTTPLTTATNQSQHSSTSTSQPPITTRLHVMLDTVQVILKTIFPANLLTGTVHPAFSTNHLTDTTTTNSNNTTELLTYAQTKPNKSKT